MKQLMQAVCKRPQMYVGELGIEGLRVFLNGYLISNKINSIIDPELNDFIDNFEDFVLRELGSSVGESSGWPKAIERVGNDQDLDVFWLFEATLLKFFDRPKEP